MFFVVVSVFQHSMDVRSWTLVNRLMKHLMGAFTKRLMEVLTKHFMRRFMKNMLFVKCVSNSMNAHEY